MDEVRRQVLAALKIRFRAEFGDTVEIPHKGKTRTVPVEKYAAMMLNQYFDEALVEARETHPQEMSCITSDDKSIQLQLPKDLI